MLTAKNIDDEAMLTGATTIPVKISMNNRAPEHYIDSIRKLKDQSSMMKEKISGVQY